MKIPLEAVIQLLHDGNQGTLASHSQCLPGYPFASALPFAVDESHCPVFLISGLAEHTRNLRADGRASLLLQARDHAEAEASARLTLLGDVEPVDDDNPLLRQRYLRFQPSAERYLDLGDFAFYRLRPRRLRLVAGFGQMGWVGEEEWARVPVLPYEAETVLIEQMSARHAVIGIDCFGIDHLENGVRRRTCFPRAVEPAQVPSMLDTLGLLDA
jgi:heme iron utilization protein